MHATPETLLYCPAPHEMHELAPLFFWYLPDAQGVQDVPVNEFDDWYVPAPQGLHTVAAGASVKWP